MRCVKLVAHRSRSLRVLVLVFALAAGLPDAARADGNTDATLRLKAGTSASQDHLTQPGLTMGGALRGPGWMPISGFVLAPQVEILLARRSFGSAAASTLSDDGGLDTSIDALDVPLLLRSELTIRGYRVYAMAGAYGSVLLQAQTSADSSTASPAEIATRLDVGLVASAGFGWASWSWGQLSAEIRYQRGYRSLLRDSDDTQETFSLLVGYGLGAAAEPSALAETSPLQAAKPSSAPDAHRLTFKGGFIASRLQPSDSPTLGVSPSEYSPGYAIGGALSPWRLGGKLALVPQLELGFSHRNQTLSYLPEGQYGIAADGSLALDYVDAAVLLRGELMIADKVLFGLGGAYGSVLARAQHKSGGEISDMRGAIRALDTGWVAGAGIEFAAVGDAWLTLELRYQRGLLDTFLEADIEGVQQAGLCLFGVTYGRPSAPKSVTRRVNSVLVGRVGDLWLHMLRFTRIERGKRGDDYGYEVRYDIPGHGPEVLFWRRADIDFDANLPGYRRKHRPLTKGRLWYPTRITQRSLPDVYEGILEIERAYAAQADGAIDAMEGFALVAGLGSAKPTLRATGPGTGAAKQAGHSAAQRSTALSPVFRKFTRSNFRHNLTKLTGVAPKGAHAHHVFPVKFAKQLREVGINVHHPKYGAWWAADAHRRAASAYNAVFDQFFLRNPNPTVQQVLELGRTLARGYGLDVLF